MGTLALLWGCVTPTSFEECAQLGDAVERSDCQYTFATAAEDPKPLVDSVESDLERDVLIVRLAESDPAHAGLLCRDVRTDSGKRRCESVLGRPHLGTWSPEGDTRKHNKPPPGVP